MKWRTIRYLIFTLLLSAILAGTGCQLSAPVQTGDTLYSSDTISTLLGESSEVVFDRLQLDPQTDTEEKASGQSIDYTLKQAVRINGAECKIRIGFYNGICTNFLFAFTEITPGYDLAKSLEEGLTSLLGSPVTYPGVARLSDLKTVEEIDTSQSTYREDWPCTLDSAIQEKILEGSAYSVLQTELRLEIPQENTATVQLRLSADPNSKTAS